MIEHEKISREYAVEAKRAAVAYLECHIARTLPARVAK
jgi:hypothetical protein